MSLGDIVPFRGQRQMLALPWAKPDIQSFALVAGYGFGKSTTQDMILSDLAERYWKYDVRVALFSNTISLLKKTVVADFVKWLIQSGSRYHYDRSQNTITIGKMTFLLLASGRPEDIYGPNVHVSLSDEMDELEQTKCVEAHRAIQERTRLILPDGRKPFSVFTTTAQGFKGTYQIIEQYKEAGTPYALVRGKTKDNTALDPGYVKRLYSLYNENEQLAFLEGHFVNLTSGKVYPKFDPAKHEVEPFDIYPDETIHIGQDLNQGYSKALAFIIRNRNLYAVREWSFDDIGSAPETFRAHFPANRILWYPDNSGKGILGGYADHADAFRVEIVWTGRNPSILDRTFAVNLAFGMGRMFAFKNLKMWPMALKTRGYDKNGVAEKGSGPTSPDHICDAGEYATFWILANQEEFADIYELTPAARKENG